MNIYDEYINYHNQYSSKYGKNNTLVLHQTGSFYELYSTLQNGIGDGPNLQEISQILNIICTRKDKSVKEISRKNPYLLGFPLVSTSKYINILIENGYTLVVVDQVSPPPNPKRKITGIYSPGTFITGPQRPDYNYICSIFIEELHQKTGKYLMCIGMTAIDVTTGKCIIYEVHSMESDDRYALDECLRFINSINPTEIIMCIQKDANSKTKNEDIHSYLELQNRRNTHYRDTLNKKYFNIAYQTEFLKKIYSDCGQYNPIEFLDIDKYINGTISFIILLDFLYDHNNKIVDNLSKPIYYSDSKTVVLGNNAISQLNVIDNNSGVSGTKFKSLFNVVNQTSTNMGRRYLRDKLTSPIVSPIELNKIYDCIQELYDGDLFIKYESILKDINDIERLQHKIPLGYLHPYEFAALIQSYENITEIIDLTQKTNFCCKYLPDKVSIDSMTSFMNDIQLTFRMDELKKHNLTEITTNIFNIGIYKDLDSIENEILNAENFMDNLRDVLCGYIDDKNKKKISNRDNIITVKKNERDGHYLNTSKIRSKILKKNLEGVKIIEVKGYKLDPSTLIFKDNNNNTKIMFPDMEEKSEKIEMLVNNMRSLTMKYYTEYICGSYKKYTDMYCNIVKFVSFIDYIKSNAKVAKLYGYTKPTISYNDKYSFIDCKKLRHPIIERIIDYEYIPHDIKIGVDNLKGILLYGLNSSGKCFEPNTMLRMYNGTLKKARCITKGDRLMGDDSNPRTVLSTTRGSGIMYKIKLYHGQQFIVNGPHILCLKCIPYRDIKWIQETESYYVSYFSNGIMNNISIPIQNGELKKYEYMKIAYSEAKKILENIPQDQDNIIEIPVDEYITKSDEVKKNYYLYRTQTNYEKIDVDIDPYIIGYWLMNNNNDCHLLIKNSDVYLFIYKYFEKSGHLLEIIGGNKYKIIVESPCCNNNKNTFIGKIKKMGIYKNKFIPSEYKLNNRTNRLKILAGIIDSGNCSLSHYKNKLKISMDNGCAELIEDILELAYGLGYGAYVKNNVITIISNNYLEIPFIKNDLDNIRDYTGNLSLESFTIESVGKGEYCGFETDGNKRFLLANSIVTHNSSSMKALGLCTIMAQAGMFVPAETCIFSPYKSLFTRITGNDNLFKGLSSFTLEMLELKAILKRADPFTLVIGDEVCRGTEHISGNAIVASTIINLAKVNASFIFATHLHEIAKMERIKQINTIKPYHLSVTYDHDTDTLIYDRQLKEGQGEEIYGITVAKYIIQDNDFLNTALEIKNELLKSYDSLISGKTSKYNSQVFIHQCQICGKKEVDGLISELHTHHINFQKDCDSGLVKKKKHLRKNDKANLVVLCVECHENIHHKGLDIEKIIQTSKGNKILFKLDDHHDHKKDGIPTTINIDSGKDNIENFDDIDTKNNMEKNDDIDDKKNDSPIVTIINNKSNATNKKNRGKKNSVGKKIVVKGTKKMINK